MIGRRNLQPIDRIGILTRVEEIVAKKAKLNERARKGAQPGASPVELPNLPPAKPGMTTQAPILAKPSQPIVPIVPIDTRAEMAERDRRIFDLWMACYTETEIAEAVGDPRTTVQSILTKTAELPESSKPAANHLTDFEPPIYNVWKQQVPA